MTPDSLLSTALSTVEYVCEQLNSLVDSAPILLRMLAVRQKAYEEMQKLPAQDHD